MYNIKLSNIENKRKTQKSREVDRIGYFYIDIDRLIDRLIDRDVQRPKETSQSIEQK